MMRNKKNKFMSGVEKQNTVLAGEVTPENAFTKLSVIAMHAADKYKLKNFKINTRKDKA